MKINVLTESLSPGGIGFNVPLREGGKIFKDRKIFFDFFWNDPLDEKLVDCDCLFINSKVFRTWWGADKKERMLERYEHFRKRVGKIYYFDTTDSSGTLQADLLPYVAAYSKSFLLKNKRAYLKPFYGGRIFTDFYHTRYGVKDQEEITVDLQKPILEQDLQKLRVSWNSALTFGSGWKHRILNIFDNRFTAPEKSRPIDLTCRMTVNHQRETIRYQRERIAEMLQGRGVKISKLRKKEYLREMKASKIGVSPFGWGEFAFRDFEVFKHGCVLLKPDVSHLETWPDLYRSGETYANFSWDFQDFQQVISGLLDDPAKALGIAVNGQNRYKWYVESQEARLQFCDRITNLVNEV